MLSRYETVFVGQHSKRRAQFARRFFLYMFLVGVPLTAVGADSVSATDNQRIPIKVVVVSMFETGELTGDAPGEFQLWIERMPLKQEWQFPLGEYPLRSNDDGVLGICTGGGQPNATASIMALGLDPRFDLSQAYWLIAGIAGGDPEDVSLGSAVWAQHAVDGDLLYQIDGREIPEDWPYGQIPLGGEAPADQPEDIYTDWTLDTIHFPLNGSLARWAYALTREVPLLDTPALRDFRKQFTARANARRTPFVTLGETLASSTYWHGDLMNRWANDWVRVYAGADANFMTSGMEDAGTLTALGRLARLGKVDTDRVLILRTVSNYTTPPAGRDAAWSTTAPYPDDGYPALDTAYRVGRAAVDALLKDWPQTRDTIPGSDD